MSSLDNMKTRLSYAGGGNQQDRMIESKLRSLKKAMLYSYQAATAVLEDGREFRCLINPDNTREEYRDKIISIPFEDIRVGNTTETVDPVTGEIKLFNQKRVVEEVEDDFFEISLEEARETNPEINIDDLYDIPVSIDNFMRATAMHVKTVLKQKVREAEKEAVYNEYIDKKDEIINLQLDLIRKMTENNIRRLSDDIWGSTRAPANPGQTPQKPAAPHCRSPVHRRSRAL